MNGLEPILTQNIASLATAGVFIWYLVRKDKQANEMYEKFNTTLTNHLEHWIKTQKEFASSQMKLAKNLQALTDCIKALNGRKNETRRSKI